ncbi:MAG TPA: sigma-70 factor domain-containing protein, partial [Nitrospiria bacterium]
MERSWRPAASGPRQKEERGVPGIQTIYFRSLGRRPLLTRREETVLAVRLEKGLGKMRAALGASPVPVREWMALIGRPLDPP